MRGLVVALAAALAPVGRVDVERAGAGELAPAVEREWRVRAAALAPERAALEAWLLSSDWTSRHDALAALARADPGRRFAADHPALVRPALSDPHPNVRAAVLALACTVGDPSWLDRDQAAALASDPLPEVRANLAGFLGEVAPESAGDECAEEAWRVDLLARLARDDAPSVRERARRELLAYGAPAAGAVRALLAADDGRALAERVVDAAPVIRLGPLAPELARALRELAGAGEARGFVEAVLCASGVDALHSAIVSAVCFPPPGRRDGVDFARRRAIVREAARFGGEALAEAAFEAAERRLAERAPARAALRAAVRVLGSRLGALLDPLDRDVEFLLQLASAGGLSPHATLERARRFPERLARGVWEALAARGVGEWGRAPAWDASHVAWWLAPEREAATREAAARGLAPALAEGDPGAEAALLPTLERDPGLRALVLRWMCRAPGVAGRLDRVFAAWQGWSEPERMESLRELPRDVAPVPFRTALLELARTPATRTPSVVDLLALFEGDAEVARVLQRALEEQLSAIEAEVDPSAASLLAAAALVRALERAGALEVALASEVLERTAHLAATEPPAGAELAAAAAAALGRSAAGRVVLGGWLAREAPARVRTEAALALAGAGEVPAAAAAALVEAWPELRAPEARARAVALFGELQDPSSGEFLERLARAGGELDQRIAAVDALGRRGRVTTLVELLDVPGEHEVARAAALALGRLATPAARAGLERALATLESDSPADDLEALERELLRGDVLVALAECAPEAERLHAELLRRPLECAAVDLVARFRGGAPPSAGFHWEREIAAARRVARAGELGALLRATPQWWRLDARLLAELAAVAFAGGVEPEAARDLARGALVAVAGEPPHAESARLAARALVRLAALEVELGRDESAADACGRLLARARAGDDVERHVEALLGVADPRRGVDPLAHLAASRHQARARAALARGEREEAARLAAAARERLGASRAARAAQERLEARLAE